MNAAEANQAGPQQSRPTRFGRASLVSHHSAFEELLRSIDRIPVDQSFLGKPPPPLFRTPATIVMAVLGFGWHALRKICVWRAQAADLAAGARDYGGWTMESRCKR